jgi:PAS domain S-box-containing protein
VASGRADLIGKVNVAQLEIARKVAEYGDFVVGNSVMSTTYAHPMIHFAVPVKTTRPSVDYFLGKAVQLDTWGLDTDAPAGCPGARLSIMDRDGVLLHNYPPGMDGLGLGQTIPEWLWNRISESVRGESIVADPAGGRWFLAHRALDLDDASAPDLYVVVSAPYAQVAESANRSLRRELLLLLVTTVGSMLIAITLGNRTLVNVLERITEAARRLGQGDLSARIGVTPQQTGELWDLARTIDTMAAGLEQDRALRQRAQEQLRESEEKFAKAFHTSPYAITLTHARDGTLIEVNEAFTRLTGYTRAEVIGQTTLHLALWTNPQDRERIRAALEAGQAVVDEELRFRKRNGEILLGQMSARMIRLQDEPCILSSVADISQRKQAEAEMARQLDELQRWRDTTMEREGRVMELKREINSLLAQMGEAPRYPSAAAEPGHAPTP